MEKEIGCKSCSQGSCSHGLCTHDACISRVPIFNHLEPKQMEEIMGVIKTTHYKKGEFIYSQGDAADSLYIVNSGRVRIYRLAESGKIQLMRILNPGDFTGELALFRASIQESYGEAICQTDICRISGADLQQFLLKFPTISLKILQEFSERLATSEIQTTRFATEKVETRLALYLCECLEGQDHQGEVVLPMSKKDLASYLGTTPETLSRKLTELEENGYIKQQNGKRIQIIDVEGLLKV